MKLLLALLMMCGGCAWQMPKPATKAEVRAQWVLIGKTIQCGLDAGAHLTPCLSDDRACCEGGY